MNYQSFNDFELVKLFQAGQQKAFEAILKRYQQKVFTYIHIQVKNKTIANDIFQETFLKVLNSLRNNKYSHNGKLLAWIIRIAHNLIIDYFRKKSKMNTISNEQEDFDIFNLSQFSETTIDEKINLSQIHKNIKKLIQFLPQEQREVIILRHFTGMGFKEIAAQTNVSINTALGRMRYALINLRKLIKENQLDIYMD